MTKTIQMVVIVTCLLPCTFFAVQETDDGDKAIALNPAASLETSVMRAQRICNNKSWPNAATLPRFLKQAGYRTAHFGKWHLTNAQTEGAPRPEAYGYDESAVFNGGAGWGRPEGVHDTAKDTVAFIQANKDKPFFINVWIHCRPFAPPLG